MDAAEKTAAGIVGQGPATHIAYKGNLGGFDPRMSRTALITVAATVILAVVATVGIVSSDSRASIHLEQALDGTHVIVSASNDPVQA